MLHRSLALLFALGICPAPATASNLDLGKLAALLVAPIITGGQAPAPANVVGDVIVPGQRASTLVTVTNGSSEDRVLVVNVVSGDVGEDAWESDSFECPITGRETTTFVFSPAGPGASLLQVECGQISVARSGVLEVDTAGAEIRATTVAQNGFVVLAVADPQLPRDAWVIGEDALLGDVVVVDPVGQAYSFPALGFQTVGTNDGDRAYAFGTEYSALPGVLASSFIAEGPDNDVEAELILLTLDGRAGGRPTPRVALRGSVYDDDENARGFDYRFDCFDVVALSEISKAFRFDPANSLSLQTRSGHFDLAPRSEGTTSPDPHDFTWGDANDTRNRGVHGWIVQSVNGVLIPGDQPVRGAAPISTDASSTWARPLLQSTTALVPAGADTPAFDAR